MCSIKQPAAKNSNHLRNHCCTSLHGLPAVSLLSSLAGFIRRLICTNYRLGTGDLVRTIFKYIQASQEEPRTEIASIDSAVNCRWIALHAQPLQRFRQFLVAPVSFTHCPLNPHAGFEAPFFHCLPLCLCSVGFRRKRYGATDSIHFSLPRVQGGSKNQLESILSHQCLWCLYRCPNLMEAIPHA